MYRAWNEKEKASIVKNTIFAMKLIWKIDKGLPLGYLMAIVSEKIFSLFIQNVLFLKILLSAIDGNKDFSVYVKYLTMFFAVSAFSKVTKWLGYYWSHSATKRVLQGLNNLVFEKASSLDISCYEDPDFYDNYQRATNVLQNGYFDIICWNISTILGNAIAFACIITTVSAINPVYLCFLLPVILVFAVQIIRNKLLYKRNVEMTRNNRVKAYVQRTVFLRDYAKDIRTSNIFFVLMKRFEAAIKSNIEIYKKFGIKLFLCSLLSSLFGEFIPVIGTYAYAGYEFIYTKSLTISGFSVVLSSINSIRFAILQMAECFDELSFIAMYFQDLKRFFDYEEKIVDGSLKADKFEKLEFKDVTFTYPGASKPSLENVSFTINKGETIGIVGVNGAGKSTLVKLLLRFYDADSGEILYNGVNIKEYDVDSLRGSYATVFQDYKNFAISVFENVICHECSDEEKELAEIAMEKSGAWEKIKTLSKGGDTVLTREFEDDGVGLSGGESQKVSTARLFARDFEIAILDEPSSALDPIAEYKMYENLVNATENKTVVYISHRLSSATLSDKIIVIDKGKVVEQGKHQELMELGGVYSKMFALQASNYNKEADIDE
ncbi:MAG: ABC transporter ATP-binding protein [Eubacterium sp.]